MREVIAYITGLAMGAVVPFTYFMLQPVTDPPALPPPQHNLEAVESGGVIDQVPTSAPSIPITDTGKLLCRVDQEQLDRLRDDIKAIILHALMTPTFTMPDSHQQTQTIPLPLIKQLPPSVIWNDAK